MLLEQTQKQEKQIAKYKQSGYTTLNQKQWKDKQKSDPNGKFANVENFYYGYIASSSESSDPKPKDGGKSDSTEKPISKDTRTTTPPPAAPSPAPPTSSTESRVTSPTIDCSDMNNVTMDNLYGDFKKEERREEFANEFNKWVTTNFPMSYPKYEQKYKTSCPNFNIQTLVENKSLHKSGFMKYLMNSYNKITDKNTNEIIDGSLLQIYKYVGGRNVSIQKKAQQLVPPSPSPTPTPEPTPTPQKTVSDSEISNLFKNYPILTNLYKNSKEVVRKSLEMDNRFVGYRTIGCSPFMDDYSKLKTFTLNDNLNNNREIFCAGVKQIKQAVKACALYDNGKRKKYEEWNNLLLFHPKDFKFNYAKPNDDEYLGCVTTKNESIIKRKLIEYKNMKPLKEAVKEKLVERHLFKKHTFRKTKHRLEKISEDYKKQNYRKFFDNLLKYANNYNNSKVGINESVDETFSKAFNMIFQGSESEAKEKAVDYFISKFQASGVIADNIRKELSSVSNASELFTNPDMVSEKIADAVIESARQESASDDGTLMSAVSSTIQKFLPEKKGELMSRIKEQIMTTQSKLQGNIVGLADEVKSKFLEIVKKP